MVLIAARVAQLEELPICNRPVACSIRAVGTSFTAFDFW